MQELVPKKVNVHARCQELVVVRALGKADEHLIGNARHHEMHRNPAQHGRPKRVQERFIRNAGPARRATSSGLTMPGLKSALTMFCDPTKPTWPYTTAILR